MITGLFLTFLHGVAAAVFGWTGSHLPSPPTFWTDAASAVSTFVGLVPSGVRYFVPIGPVVVAAGAFIALVVSLGFVRLVRRVVSLFTGGGGMA